MLHVLLLNRMQFVPEREPARDDQSNKNADQKEPAISRQRDQQNRYDNDRDDETRRSLQAESRPAARFRLHDFILARLSRAAALQRVSDFYDNGNYPMWTSKRKFDKTEGP